jgi:PKD repeat protein
LSNRISSLDAAYLAGDLSLFPQALDDRDHLYVATNNSTTMLRQTLTYVGKTVIVDSTEGFPSEGIIRVGIDGGSKYELIAYGKKTGNSFQTLQRGFAGSKQGFWVPGKITVSNAVSADHHNAVKDAVINIETDLGLESDPADESLNGILKTQEVRFLTPKPVFMAFPLKGPPPLKIRFQNLTTGYVVRYLWDFGDGGTSTERSPNHTYLTEGKYTVKLNIITSSKAQGIVTKTNYIEVNVDESLPFMYVDSVSQPYSVETATVLTNGGDPTDAKEFVFVDQTDGDIVQRNWIFGDGNQRTETDPDIHTASHIYSSPGSYPVSCIVIFSNGRLKNVQLSENLVVL